MTLRFEDRQPPVLANVSLGGNVKWVEHANPEAIMRSDMEHIYKVAMLALWYATHPNGDSK